MRPFRKSTTTSCSILCRYQLLRSCSRSIHINNCPRMKNGAKFGVRNSVGQTIISTLVFNKKMGSVPVLFFNFELVKNDFSNLVDRSSLAHFNSENDFFVVVVGNLRKFNKNPQKMYKINLYLEWIDLNENFISQHPFNHLSRDNIPFFILDSEYTPEISKGCVTNKAQASTNIWLQNVLVLVV
uniref:Uncharacterized protein n=1 Tax=Meloidogyne incognita TaxID=6306 RepID=A0A914LFB9_MELIC